jgi:hypothetical protein
MGMVSFAELGKQPDAKFGKEVLGVVIEAPMRGAYDTLAGYQDGRRQAGTE